MTATLTFLQIVPSKWRPDHYWVFETDENELLIDFNLMHKHEVAELTN